MIIRVKLVIIRRAAGRNDREVISISVCKLKLYDWPPPGVGVLENADIPG
jgi:hypothetical protein